MDFVTVYSAVLFANLLTIAAIWAVVTLTRQESAGKHDGYGLPLGVFLMVGFFVVVGIMGATDRVPEWMKSAGKEWTDLGDGVRIRQID